MANRVAARSVLNSGEAESRRILANGGHRLKAAGDLVVAILGGVLCSAERNTLNDNCLRGRNPTGLATRPRGRPQEKGTSTEPTRAR